LAPEEVAPFLYQPRGGDDEGGDDAGDEAGEADEWCAGDEELPVREDVLLSFIHAQEQSGRGNDGIANKASRLRKAFLDDLFVKDNNDIPTGKTYTHRHSCRELHPGLCCQDACYKDALLLAKSLERCLAEKHLGRFFKIIRVGEDFSLSQLEFISSLIHKLDVSRCAFGLPVSERFRCYLQDHDGALYYFFAHCRSRRFTLK
jgi:hypothetical protein